MQHPFVITFEIPVEDIIEKTINFGPGIIGVVADGNYNGLIDPAIDASYIDSPTLDNVIAIAVDGIPYSAVYTELEMQQNVRTFYWNDGAEFIQLHIPNGTNKHSIQSIVVGVSLAWFKSSLPTNEFDGKYNGLQYKPLLLNTPEFVDEFDDLFNGRMPLTPWGVTIQNNDGVISRIMEDGNFLNRVCFLKSWYGDFGNTTVVLTQRKVGVIDSITVGPVVDFKMRDARDKFKKETPTREIDLTVWTDCDSSYVIPEIWGSCRRIPLQCINENSAGANWHLMLADVENLDISAITRLTYKGATVAAPAIGVSADNVAYISMAKATYPESGEFKADIDGYIDPDTTLLIENPLDIISWKNFILYGETYNSVYYETAEWEDAKLYVYAVNFFWNEKMKWREQIEQINASAGGVFNISNETNKYTFQLIVSDLAIDVSIPEIRDLPKDARNKIGYESASKIISVCRVGYSKRYDEDKYIYHTDDSKAVELYPIVNSAAITKSFPTNITNQIDAARAAEKYIYLYGRKLRYVEKTYFLSALYDTLRSGRFVGIEFIKDGFNMGFMRTFITRLLKNYDTAQITIAGYMYEEDESGYLEFIDDDSTVYDASLEDDFGEADYYVI